MLEFTKEQIDRFNRFTMFETTVEEANRRFREDSEKIIADTKEKLRRYGIEEIPEDVQAALDRLEKARYDMFLARIRAREIAPPVSVVGPARYSEHANPDRAERIIKRAVEDYEKAQEGLRIAIKRHSPNAPILSDDPEAISKLQAKIEQAERLQETMKQANQIIRKKNLSNEEKVQELIKLGLKSEIAWKLLEPDFMGRVGFPDYALRNNLANIKRLKARLEELKTRASQETSESRIGEITIVDNVEENRVQIFFPEKPSAEIRNKLKAYGFRWAPSIGAWQRHRSTLALQLAKEICEAS